MEPRSWQWIQGAVIAAAMAIGIALAVWYENRPIASPLPVVAAKAPKKQRAIVPPDEGIITGLVSDKPSPTEPVSGAKDTDTTASVPAPSQYPTNAWQKEVTDPMAHTSTPATVSPPIVGTPPPSQTPVDTGIPSSSPSTPPSSDVGSPPVTAPVTDTAPADSGPPAVSTAPTTGTP